MASTFRDYRMPALRLCVRVFRRPRSAPQRPYFSRRYTLASFGAGPIGVMVMRVLTTAEVQALTARASREGR